MLYFIAGLFTIASAIGLAIWLIVDAYNFVFKDKH